MQQLSGPHQRLASHGHDVGNFSGQEQAEAGGGEETPGQAGPAKPKPVAKPKKGDHCSPCRPNYQSPRVDAGRDGATAEPGRSPGGPGVSSKRGTLSTASPSAQAAVPTAKPQAPPGRRTISFCHLLGPSAPHKASPCRSRTS